MADSQNIQIDVCILQYLPSIALLLPKVGDSSNLAFISKAYQLHDRLLMSYHMTMELI